MNARAILWLLVYVAGCAAAVVNPLYGLLTYFFTYYVFPPMHWWGRRGLPELRWSFFVAVLTAILYVVRGPGAPGPRAKIFDHPQSKWLMGLIAIAALVTPYAVSPDVSFEYATKLAKAAALYVLILKLLTTMSAYRALLSAHILGGFYWGLWAFFDPETEGGRLVNVGGPDSETGDTTAAHVLTILPFVGYYIVAGRRWERLLCLAAAPFIVNMLIAINSRGSIVALAVAGLGALVLGWRSYRGKTMLGLAAGVASLLILSGPKFLERQTTTLRPEDKAALSRLDMWKAGVEVMRDHPFGAGGHGYDLLSPVYLPEAVERTGRLQTAHNTYLLAGSEWGVPGLLCLLLYLWASFRELNRLRAATAETSVQQRVQLEALAMMVVFIGYLTAGFFVNRFYAEATYWLGGLTAGLRNIWMREEQRTSQRSTDAVQGREGRGAGSAPEPGL